MTVIALTPKKVEKFALLSKKATVTVSLRTITFNPTAVKKLALKQGDYVRLEIKDDKLYFVQDVTKQGFQLNNQSKYGSLSAGAKGLYAALVTRGFYRDLNKRRLKFEVQDFKDGKNELRLIVEKIKNMPSVKLSPS